MIKPLPSLSSLIPLHPIEIPSLFLSWNAYCWLNHHKSASSPIEVMICPPKTFIYCGVSYIFPWFSHWKPPLTGDIPATFGKDWEGLAPGLASATTPPGTVWGGSSRRMHRRDGKCRFSGGNNGRFLEQKLIFGGNNGRFLEQKLIFGGNNGIFFGAEMVIFRGKMVILGRNVIKSEDWNMLLCSSLKCRVCALLSLLLQSLTYISTSSEIP